MKTYKNCPLPEEMTQRENTILFEVRKSTGQAVKKRRSLVTKAKIPPKAATFKSQH